uniref:Uncharacterized protein n=1 Tax=Bos indicus x Bos taurus TaxID=30522 RepID=A0A4W2D4N5_BOBOX
SQIWRGQLTGPETSSQSEVDPRPLSPAHCTTLLSWTRTVSPEKATRSQDTAPLPDHSQEISAAQSQVQLFGTAHPPPNPEARSGAGRPGWFISSRIVFQTMGKLLTFYKEHHDF